MGVDVAELDDSFRRIDEKQKDFLMACRRTRGVNSVTWPYLIFNVQLHEWLKNLLRFGR